MEITTKVEGLDQLLKNIGSVLPDPRKQRSWLNQAMSYSAKRTLLSDAKIKAESFDGSGALAESLKPRARSRSQARRRGVTAWVQVGVVRKDVKAAAKYANYYRNTSVVQSGIRHGHLVEFGHRTKNGYVAARPFLGSSIGMNTARMVRLFSARMKRLLENRMRRMRKK